jgi:L-alanine-DL-glutamate epimerase-like enolase superfamily enzyme
VSFAPLRESILREPICIQEGFAHVPDGPGLGIDLNWERVLEHTI